MDTPPAGRIAAGVPRGSGRAVRARRMAALLLAAVGVSGWSGRPRAVGPKAALQVDPQAALVGLRPTGASGWMRVHVVHGRCGCSIPVLDRLLVGPRPDGVVEVVLFGGDDPTLGDRLRARGIRFVATPMHRLRRHFDVAHLPILAVVSPSDAIVYLGADHPHRRSVPIGRVTVHDAKRPGPGVGNRAAVGDNAARRRPPGADGRVASRARFEPSRPRHGGGAPGR